MSITAYPRTIVKGQVAANGNANSGVGLMLWDSATGTYIAATPSTFSAGGGGDATAANQTTQIAAANTGNSTLVNVDNSLNNLESQVAYGSNTGILNDTIQTAICTIFPAPLFPFLCKYVTIVNYASNSAAVQITIGANTMQLDKGYSIRLNVSSSGFISVGQSTGEGNTIAYIVTQ